MNPMASPFSVPPVESCSPRAIGPRASGILHREKHYSYYRVIPALSFRPPSANDGKSVITVGRDDGARVWNIATGEKVAELRAPTDGQSSPAWTADGRRVIPEVFTGIL